MAKNEGFRDGAVTRFAAAAVATACATTQGAPVVTQATREFAAEPEVVVDAIANLFSANGFRVLEASAYRFMAEKDNTNMMAQVLFGTQASGYRVVDRLDCAVSALNQVTRVSCQGAMVSNPGNAFERVNPGVNVAGIQQTFDAMAAERGW